MQQLDLDLCPGCDLPTFNHETVENVDGDWWHLHCRHRTVWVVKKEHLRRPYRPTE